MVQILIEFFFIFWTYLAEVLFIEKILQGFGIDPHKNNVKHIILMHIIQISLVLIIIFLAIIFYLTFIKYGINL